MCTQEIQSITFAQIYAKSWIIYRVLQRHLPSACQKLYHVSTNTAVSGGGSITWNEAPLDGVLVRPPTLIELRSNRLSCREERCRIPQCCTCVVYMFTAVVTERRRKRTSQTESVFLVHRMWVDSLGFRPVMCVRRIHLLQLSSDFIVNTETSPYGPST